MSTAMKDLKLWQESVALGSDVIRAVRQHGRRETRALTDRMTMDAITLAEGIGEGYGEQTAAAQLTHFARANRSLMAMEGAVAMARQGGIFPDATAAALAQKLTLVGRLLHGYVTYVERQAASEREEEDATVGS
jgi:four helix bundle protein